MADLHVFRMMHGPDTMVASNIDDAWSAWSEHMGESPEDYRYNDDFYQLPDDRQLAILRDPACGDTTEDTMTCAEWAAKNGRGFLCSTEW